jgi:hypothetical protein
MRWTEEPLDESTPGVRRFNFGYVGEPPPELAAHLDRLADLHTRERQRKLQRHDVPDFRKPPKKEQQQPLFQFTDPIPFPLDPDLDVRLELSNIRGYSTGVAFELVARETTMHASFLGERVNVSHRIKAKHIGRVYLGVVLPSGKIVTNKTCTPPQAPEDDDPTTPWLYGGRGYSSQSETRATYFISPRPDPSGIVTFTISYPLLGIDTASSIAVDSTEFRPTRQTE